MYQPELGRWSAIDPSGQFASPYVGMGNSPMIGNDPNGEFFWLPVMIGAFIGAYSSYQTGVDVGLKGWDLFGMTLIGAVGGGIMGGASASLANVSNSSFLHTTLVTGVEGSMRSSLSGGDIGQGFLQGAVSGGLGFHLSTAGLKIASKFALSGNKATYGEGLINLGFEAAGTAAKSIVTNVVTSGFQEWDSRLDIGVGDFTLHFRDGKQSKNFLDNLDNLVTAYNYGEGAKEVILGKAKFRIDPLSFSPRFTETKTARFGYKGDVKKKTVEFNNKYYGSIRRILSNDPGKPSAINRHGAIFVGYGISPGHGVLVHEALHSIDDRLRGQFNDFIDKKLYKSNTWWEDRLERFFKY